MTIREATPADVEGVRRVARDSWEHDYPDLLTQETIREGVDEWYDEESIRETLSRPRTVLRVAEADAEVVGFAHAMWTNDAGHVLRLYVHPDSRREGVGRALLEQTCEDLFERGCETVSAMVLDGNDLGSAFYRDYGFEQVGQEETTIGGERHTENTFELAAGDRVD